MSASGQASPNTTTVNVQSYDGTNWSEIANVNTGRYALTGAGIQTSGIVFGGSVNPKGQTETWNGTAWSEVADLNTVRNIAGGAGTSNSSALAFGGTDAPSPTVNTEQWDGTSWTEVANLAVSRGGLGGTGTVTLALAFGGTPPVYSCNRRMDSSSLYNKNF